VRQVLSRSLESVSSVNGAATLARGATKKVAAKFSCHRSAASRVWTNAKRGQADPSVAACCATPQEHRCGRGRECDGEGLAGAMRQAPSDQRTSRHALAGALGAPRTMLQHCQHRDDVTRPHSNALEPHLTPPHKGTRVACVASRAAPTGQAGGVTHEGDDEDKDDTHSEHVSDSSHDETHVDEEWPSLAEESRCLRLAKDERAPDWEVVDKGSVTRVVSLCAVACPHFNSEGECVFDGKTGVWPSAETVVTQGGSRRRPRGAPESESVGVTGEARKQSALERALPAACRRWPEGRRLVICLRHDNAPSRLTRDAAEWLAAAGWEGRVRPVSAGQGAGSLGTDVLDLGLFRPSQGLQWGRCRRRRCEASPRVSAARLGCAACSDSPGTGRLVNPHSTVSSGVMATMTTVSHTLTRVACAVKANSPATWL